MKFISVFLAVGFFTMGSFRQCVRWLLCFCCRVIYKSFFPLKKRKKTKAGMWTAKHCSRKFVLPTAGEITGVAPVPFSATLRLGKFSLGSWGNVCISLS